jgi:hypothetical protein
VASPGFVSSGLWAICTSVVFVALEALQVDSWEVGSGGVDHKIAVETLTEVGQV